MSNVTSIEGARARARSDDSTDTAKTAGIVGELQFDIQLRARGEE